jgi:branched-chain amino acid transport system ATP-binding protein
MPLLEVQDVVAGYGAAPVLHGISLALGAKERVGLFGPNGHGKTTLLRVISGLLTAQGGTVCLGGEAIEQVGARRIVERGLIHVPQANMLFPELTVLENLDLGAYSRRARPHAAGNLERVLTLFPRLQERRRQPVKTLSGGERQMVSIGVGLMGQPAILMLDEPTLGLAPKIKDELLEAIGAIARRAIPLLIVEQDVDFLLALTDRLYMIQHGGVALETAAGAGLDHDAIMQMYFGQETAA